MSRLELPLKYQTLWNTGDVIVRGEIDLLLKDPSGNWIPLSFRVDSASDMTTFPAYRAKQLGLPIPQNPALLTHEQTGLEVRSGYLRCRVAGLDPTENIFSRASSSEIPTHRPLRQHLRRVFQEISSASRE